MAKYLILSIDGGGTRGIIPATILECIARDSGKHPTEIFDMMAGTSTGGIICIGLAAMKPPSRLVDLYLKESKKIFHDTGWDDFRDGFGKNLGADYSQDELAKILKEEFGNTTLGDVHTSLQQTHQKEKILMVTSFDLNPQDSNGKQENFKPAVFNSSFKRDREERLVDLALRTSAGPTYFPIYQKKYVDGGVALNHPAMAAVAFALNCGEDEKEHKYREPDGLKKGLNKSPAEIKVLSLGCGTSNGNSISPQRIGKGDWGNLKWIKYLPDLLTESNVQASEYYVQQVLGATDYKRIQLEFDDKDAPEVIRKELAEGRMLGLDVKDEKLLQGMHDYAKAYYEKNKTEILLFLDLLTPQPPIV